MYHKLNEPFEIDGKTYVAKEDNSHGVCFRCAFNETGECRTKKCEPGHRADGLSVRFDEIKGEK